MSQRPNILFLYPDTLRYDWVETRGTIPVRTPNLRELAERGTEFSRAITPSPLCAPARACLALGMEYDNCRVPGNNANLPLDMPNMFRLLRGAGYHVMGCGKFDLHKPELDWGLDGKRLLDEWGFSDGIDNEGKMDGVNSYKRNENRPTGPYLAYLAQHGLADDHVADFAARKKASAFPTTLPEHAYCDNWLSQNGLDLLRAAPEDKPWFLQVNFTGPHGPWDITERMRERWQDVEHPQPVNAGKLSPEEYNGVRQNFSAMVENIDRWVGLYVGELERRGDLDNTLIVFSSDHGDMLGDHDQWGKSKPRHGSVGVPLIAAGPGVKAGQVCDLPTTTLDLTATFLEAAGLDVPNTMDSRSLMSLFAGEAETHRDVVLSGLNEWRLAYDGRYKLIRDDKGDAILYDMATDPGECVDVLAQFPEATLRLQRALAAPQTPEEG